MDNPSVVGKIRNSVWMILFSGIILMSMWILFFKLPSLSREQKVEERQVCSALLDVARNTNDTLAILVASKNCIQFMETRRVIVPDTTRNPRRR